MIFLFIVFFVCIFIIFHGMVGYPVLLKILDKKLSPEPIVKLENYEPTVSYMIVAHNEEAVIEEKLNNAMTLDYPIDRLQIIIASDNSNDSTDTIVQNFIEKHPDREIVLYRTKDHKGKTNAQNEAQKIAKGEILIMTDANSIFKADAIKQLVSSFSSDDIAYVCGKLAYSNSKNNVTSDSESTYWNLDLGMRDIESRIYTITAGNGGIYACRNSEYIDFNPISCHDIMMPYTYSKQGKRALFNPEAIAFEKAGESYSDEYGRKVRMNRDLFMMLKLCFSVLNPFRYKWFGFFFFGHRTCRYLLWVAHLLLVIISAVIAVLYFRIFWIFFLLQVLFFIIAILAIKSRIKNPIIRMIGYYGLTVLAQIHGAFNIITGKAKPTWEKAESTR